MTRWYVQRFVKEYARGGLDVTSREATDDASTAAVSAAAAGGGAFDFWRREGENCYLPTDGASVD